MVLDQFVKKACDEAKSTDGFYMKHTHALRILSKFDFSKIDEEYSCIQKQLTNLYEKQEITSEYYHLQEESLHFYLDKVTGKNAEMWLKYANDSEIARKHYHGGHIGIKNAGIGITAFIPIIDYHDQNDTWVAFVSNKQQDLNNIDPKSIEMSVAMVTSEHAHFTSHVGISRGTLYEGAWHSSISPKLHSFIAATTLQHYGNNIDTLNTVKKEYMINVPTVEMRAILIKAFKAEGQEANIFIGDNTTKCSNETLEVLTKRVEAWKKRIETRKILGQNESGYETSNIQKAQLALDIKQQALEREGVSVPIKVTEGKGYTEYLNWILQNKEGKVLHDLNPQDMEGEYAWFFKSGWLWKSIDDCNPAITCDLEALAGMGHFDTKVEHECTVETIGDSYTLTE
ncbi:MAG TPA: hypothetical protein LFW13_02915 [Rickettsia endosymbiont of Sericostoma sp.]|nr:hypothetical protein [Rickettsia endosymbiont of Sericostoma sp.]